MASNRTDSVQSSSSQPPANITSCLPYWIISAALPMQCDRGRAGRRDRIVDALDLEPGGERRRGRRRHGFRHGEGADALRALAAGDVGGFHDGAGRGAARAHDDAGARIGDVAPLEPGIGDRLLHGDMVPAVPSAWKRMARRSTTRSGSASARRAPGSESRARHIFRRARCPNAPRAARRELPAHYCRSRRQCPCR